MEPKNGSRKVSYQNKAKISTTKNGRKARVTNLCISTSNNCMHHSFARERLRLGYSVCEITRVLPFSFVVVFYEVLPTESLVDLCMGSLVTNGYHFQGVLTQQ